MNVLALELHDSNPSSNDMLFDAELVISKTNAPVTTLPLQINEVESALATNFFHRI